MSTIVRKIPSNSGTRLFTTLKQTQSVTLSRSLCTATEKLERIADEILDLTKLERYDYSSLVPPQDGSQPLRPCTYR